MKIICGGTSTSSTKQEYLSWVYTLVSNQVSAEVAAEMADNLLATLKRKVLADVAHMQDAKRLRTTIAGIFDDPDAQRETDQLLKVNIISYQCLVVMNREFSQYSDDLLDYGEMKILAEECEDSEDGPQFMDPCHLFVKTPAALKSATASARRKTFYVIVKTDTLTVSELLASLLQHGVFLCEFSSAPKRADHTSFLPMAFMKHDIAHGEFMEPFFYPNSTLDIRDVQTFHVHVTAMSDAPSRYALLLVLFMFLHEDGLFQYPTLFTKGQDLDAAAMASVQKRFVNEDDLYMSLPTRIRKGGASSDAVVGDYLRHSYHLFAEEIKKSMLSRDKT